MSETARLWTEIMFNIGYLIVVWWLVIAMWLRREHVAEQDRRTADLIMWAFAFLGFGDIGHVGFRVVAYTMGGLDATVNVFGTQLLLAPMGSLATAITFTIFYMALVMMWSARYNKPYGWFGYLLLALGVIRLLIMTHPANGWNSLQIAQPWSIYRNLFLMLMQLGVAFLILRDAIAAHDRTFIWIGAMILVSFVCYAPVIFLQQRVPQIGTLMIPKTIAYLVIAFLGFFEFYKVRTVQLETTSATT
ncbi:MAG TPA: hypothetical protein VMX95_01735 [Thermodesulfobacteriota bacterium]|nr:hypothetical protein [Thermodesulfobacteriota bacterium]